MDDAYYTATAVTKWRELPLNVQAIAGPSVRTVKGDSKMTSKVISDFKILNIQAKLPC